ncbi:MAG: N-6 DNA methylase [Oscillospiraceae bacterium]|nr:N-6 DNA methylase [Oscillospiraceae bacterium]
MAVEQYTESLTLREMKCVLGDNGWGYVFPQGDASSVDKLEKLLKKAGGKPIHCGLDDFTQGGNGRAKPEYIITMNDDANTIIVVECKNTANKHASEDLSCPRGFAVDGVLYYAKFLKEEYNVIAIAVSGTTLANMKVEAFHWLKGQDIYLPLKKATDIILEPKNYIKLVKGEKLQKDYSLDEIRETAIEMHDCLREIKVVEAHKPIFIAGILIALSDDDFCKMYSGLPSFRAVMSGIQSAIENVLESSGIKSDRAAYIKQVFRTLQDNTKFSGIPLIQKKSINWYIEQLELKIKPMMDYADSTVDALGVFYHEFIKYSGGDGSGLGIVLTPQHLTEFMCDLAEVNKNSRVVDICCGSGSFLITAMSKMFKNANPKEAEDIRQSRLYGIEFDDGLYTLAIANMIIRQDGKSNIYKGDCFNPDIKDEIKAKNVNVGLINPPYSQTDKCELEFVEQLLEMLSVSGTGVVVVPMSCAIGTKFKDARERLFKKHTLKAVFSMPDDIFYPTATNPCVMVWEAHRAHDSKRETFFGYCKNDGFVKRKKLGRVDYCGTWKEIEGKWLELYRNRDIADGLSARQCVKHNDEWLCEAYMKTDYTRLTQEDFGETVRLFLSYQVANGISDLTSAFTIHNEPIHLNMNIVGEYTLGELFTFKKGKRLTKADMVAGTVNFIGAISENNGVRQLIDVEPMFSPNCITVNYNGSVGEAFYQFEPFWASDDVNMLYAEGWDLNKYIAMFIITAIKANRCKFSYGRKWTLEKMKESTIKLPKSANGSPDWAYMEKYIKSLPYSDRI